MQQVLLAFQCREMSRNKINRKIEDRQEEDEQRNFQNEDVRQNFFLDIPMAIGQLIQGVAITEVGEIHADQGNRHQRAVHAKHFGAEKFRQDDVGEKADENLQAISAEQNHSIFDVMILVEKLQAPG